MASQKPNILIPWGDDIGWWNISDWMLSHAYLIYGMQGLVAQQIEDFIKYPPRQKPAAFNLDTVMQQLLEAQSSKGH